MYTNKTALLVELANKKVLEKTGEPLSDIHQKLLELILKGNKLKDIQISGYAESTVQRVFCPKLWEVLSDTLGQKIRFNTVSLALEKLLQQEKQSLDGLGNPHYSSRSTKTDTQQNLVFPVTNLQKAIPHNLPSPSCTTFIGRESEIDRLLQLLAHDHSAHLISVDGIGGVGKTTLVLEAAYRCLQASASGQNQQPEIPVFDAIIFTSAKEFLLTPFGFLRSIAPKRTLKDIFRQIARVIDDLDITGTSFEEQVDLIHDALSCRRTLLIVDNLETVHDQQDVLGFLYELPLTVKAVITTREQIIFVPVRLASMIETDGLSLIQTEADLKGVNLTREESLQLFQVTGGIPIGITYAVGQIANGYSVPEVLHNISKATGDVARFCFESSVQALQGAPAHQLLMTLALFPNTAHQEALIRIGCPECRSDVIYKELARLRSLSLVRQDNDRYSMLPLTREYALAELSNNPEFAQTVRERWLTWYTSFTAAFNINDALSWQQHNFHDLFEEWPNLQAVMEWCQVQNRYEAAKDLWEKLRSFTQLIGRHVTRLGFWDDRMAWTAWLIQAAEQRADWPSASQFMHDYAWTLVSLSKPKQLEEAEEVLMRAWNLRQHQSLTFHIELARTCAQLKIEQYQFEEAEVWLKRATEVASQSAGQEQTQLQQLTQIYYSYGEIAFKSEKYDQAEEYFNTALDYAQENEWTRAAFMIKNWLADIAIQKNDVEKAERLLLEGLGVAEANQDRTRLAYCQQSLASLYQNKGELDIALFWIEKAMENFETLGMVPEVQEVRKIYGELLRIKS